MALIKFDKSKEKEIVWTKEMKQAKKFLPESQIKKFADFPHLLAEEIENELRQPELENIIDGIYQAVTEGDLEKLLIAKGKLQSRKIEIDDIDICERIKHFLSKKLLKDKKLTKKEMTVFNLLYEAGRYGNPKSFSLLSLTIK